MIANGRLYLRDQFVVLCFDITADEPDDAGEGQEADRTAEPELIDLPSRPACKTM